MDTLQLALFIGLLIMAVLCIFLLVWGLGMEKQLRRQPGAKYYDVHVEGTKVFSKDELNHVSQSAEADLRKAVADSSEQLRTSLTEAIDGLTKKTDEMITISLGTEFDRYNASLEKLREETLRDFNDLQNDLDVQRKVLMSELEAAVAKDREQRMDAFNERLNDVVSSYLVETLDNGMDLGAQSAYIIRTLEKYKEDIKKDVLS